MDSTVREINEKIDALEGAIDSLAISVILLRRSAVMLQAQIEMAGRPQSGTYATPRRVQ